MNNLLIITNSYDVTTEILLDKLDGQSVFRLNFDQILKYGIRINENGFEISDPSGRHTNSDAVKNAYWRKPFNAESADQQIWTKYVEAEMRYLLSELVNLLWSQQKLVLVEPYAERRTGKLMQLRQAQGIFSVPKHECLLNLESTVSSSVVKSLSNELIDDRVLYTSKVNAEDLDKSFPWFVEELIHGRQDVIVVFIRGQIFAYSLERDFLAKSVDWRQFISPEQEWKPHAVPTSFRKAIVGYMKNLRLDYGRLDFLLDENERYWFCEVNPNGQFAWLDLKGECGLLDAMIREISPATEVFPIPNVHPLDSILG